MNLKKIAAYFTKNNLWDKPFNKWSREEMLRLGKEFMAAAVDENCRFSPELFTKLVEEGVLPTDTGCPLLAACKVVKK